MYIRIMKYDKEIGKENSAQLFWEIIIRFFSYFSRDLCNLNCFLEISSNKGLVIYLVDAHLVHKRIWAEDSALFWEKSLLDSFLIAAVICVTWNCFLATSSSKGLVNTHLVHKTINY